MLLEMLRHMNAIVTMGNALTPEERNLLSLAYKNVITPKRNALRLFRNLLDEVETNRKPYLFELKAYYKIVESELRNVSQQLVGLIDTYLNKPEVEVESKVFFLKLYE